MIERFLDSGAGACDLQNSAIAEKLANALRYFDEKRYRLFAWCVMPESCACRGPALSRTNTGDSGTFLEIVQRETSESDTREGGRFLVRGGS